MFFDAVLFVVEAVTRGRRAVLVLDDFHWAPPPTQMLLRHLILSPRPLDALIIVTYRDTDLAAGHPLDDLPPDVGIERITLGGLDERAIATLLDTAPALKRRRPDLASRLHDETNGNPFFVREVLAHLVESGEIEAPDQLRDVIARRVARLSEPAQAVLTVAAVAGPTFSVAVVERAVGEQADLLDAFDEATAAGLLTEQGHGDYAFAHALVRQTIYRGLSSARRARLHRRVGEALEAVVDRDANVEALAYHFAEAAADGQADKAADYALAAGRRASGGSPTNWPPLITSAAWTRSRSPTARTRNGGASSCASSAGPTTSRSRTSGRFRRGSGAAFREPARLALRCCPSSGSRWWWRSGLGSNAESARPSEPTRSDSRATGPSTSHA